MLSRPVRGRPRLRSRPSGAGAIVGVALRATGRPVYALAVSNSPDRALFYERFAGEFDARMNRYEVAKRLRIVFDSVLPLQMHGVRLLDAGCGTGIFSAAAVERGAEVTSLDVGEALLSRVAAKCESRRVVGDVTALPFADESFDVVLCTEVIEHVREPRRAIGELVRVLRPTGQLVLTTPNRLWLPAIRLATALRLRPYEGIENWVWPRALRRWLEQCGIRLECFAGFNALPFVHPITYPLVDRLDRLGKTGARGLMINVLAVGRRRS
jgi:2-polyprenyl-3-methyl-5-hydroxy-6-metoxy-1,4-benzoquinol methylase